MFTDTPKIQYKKWKYEWRASERPKHEPIDRESKNKNEESEEVQKGISR